MGVSARLRRYWASMRLSPTARRARAERLTYLELEKLLRLDRATREAARATHEGAFVEFGVALGGSGVVIAQASKKYGRRFAGFDVFATIPPPTSDKDDRKSRDRYAAIAAGKSQGIGGDPYYGYMPDLYERVTATFDRFGVPVDGERVQLVKGLFADTWPTFEAKAIAFAHVDCDWYDPVRYCLEAVHERMPKGGVILLDDYNDYGGAKTATDEFLAAHPEYRMEPGRNVIVRRMT